ncbi:MAG: ABC transporter ATP-binding protein, partial [Nitrospirota bacterium]
MYLRLAFAVAAHLEPEIMIVDEVLAVGDATFQKKCIGKMQDVGNRGRTVLLVTHNMTAVARLCKRAILLDGGSVTHDGPADQVVGAYLKHEDSGVAERIWPDEQTAPGGGIVRLRAVRAKTEDGRVEKRFDIRRPIGIEMEYDVLKSGYVLLPHLNIDNEEGLSVFTSIDTDPRWRARARPAGRYTSTAWIPGNFLSEGMLFVEACMLTTNPRTNQFTAADAVAFQVVDSGEGDSARGDWLGSLKGAVRPLLKWETDLGGKRKSRQSSNGKKRVYRELCR